MAKVAREAMGEGDNGGMFGHLSGLRKNTIAIFLFSCAVNILMLTGPFYMLQIYDRVLASQSVPTLAVISGLVIAAYLMLGFFDILRMWLLGHIAHEFDEQIRTPAVRAWIARSSPSEVNGQRPLSNLDSIKGFLTSTGPTAIFDLPWVPIYVAVVFMLHFWLGVLAVIGVVIVLVLTAFNEWSSKDALNQTGNWAAISHHFAEKLYRSGNAANAMGMLKHTLPYWSNLRGRAGQFQLQGGNRNQLFLATTKVVRMILQSAILGLGAYLAIFQEISPGSMIMASIIAGRALAPVDAALGNWKSFVRARQAYHALNELFSMYEGNSSEFKLKAPKGNIRVSKATKLRPNDEAQELPPILSELNFNLKEGEVLAVIGHSAAGKTSLSKLLVGIWLADKGSVRLDDATLDQWNSDNLGEHIGYMPQSIDLLPGTIAQNIARFNQEMAEDEIIAASKLAGIHEMILALPKGYNTVVDEFNSVLSGGQVQRIALARAIVTKPKLLVLDEPNSNLDQEGEIALVKTLRHMKEIKTTIIVMAHRSTIVEQADKVLILEQGKQMAFGDREKILVHPGQRPQKVPRRLTPGPVRSSRT